MKGFTLIETIVYLALFSILMGGAIVAAFNIFESAGRQQTHTMLQEEGNFLIAKINEAVYWCEELIVTVRSFILDGPRVRSEVQLILRQRSQRFGLEDLACRVRFRAHFARACHKTIRRLRYAVSATG